MPKRVFKTSEQLKRERELASDWQALLKRYQFRASTPPRGVSPPRLDTSSGSKPLQEPRPQRRVMQVKSIQTVGYIPLGPSVGRPTLTPEMEAREQAAQVAIREKQSRVAPIANKMGYQYITNEDDFKTMGRKV